MRLGVLVPTRGVVMRSARRLRRLEEHVEVWRMLWRGEPVTWRGPDADLSDHTIGPLPWTEAGPPVLITAGNRGELLPAEVLPALTVVPSGGALTGGPSP